MFSRGKLLVQMCVEDSNNKNGLPDKSSEIVTNTTNIQNSNNVDNNYSTMISVQSLFEDNPLDESSGIITNTMTIENSNADDDFIVEMQPVLQASMIANENQQNVSITDDLLSEDSSEDEYQPSHTESSFSDNDEEDTRHDGYDQGNSIIPNARKKKGGRGGQEIASCLRHYILSLPESVTEINMFSDCCSGQTRNIYFSVMLSLLMEDFNKNGRSIVINHKFLEPGHTHQEADTIHGAIEKVKKYTTAKIEMPRDWANLIRMVPREPPIEVVEMQQKNILDFKSCLKSHYVHRKINTDKETINWLQIRCYNIALNYFLR
ncbi:hypothetical protein JTB14_015030 [Gonioctena quinquepunctata]|nr:hypothetical protein JTB14_015030 [Gonioctena quinquepunctata]